jgi:hypothetical protein
MAEVKAETSNHGKELFMSEWEHECYGYYEEQAEEMTDQEREELEQGAHEADEEAYRNARDAAGEHQAVLRLYAQGEGECRF